MASLAEKIAAKKAAEAMLAAGIAKHEADHVKAVEIAAIGAETKVATAASEAVAVKTEPVKEENVIVLATAIAEVPKQSVPTVVEDNPATNDILPRIRELQELSGEDLTNAMKNLKAALMQNPAAVEVLLPEDIGEMVTALRRMTGQTIAVATEKKEKGVKKEKARVLTADELAAAFDEL